jgi:hypothetical protein
MPRKKTRWVQEVCIHEDIGDDGRKGVRLSVFHGPGRRRGNIVVIPQRFVAMSGVTFMGAQTTSDLAGHLRRLADLIEKNG